MSTLQISDIYETYYDGRERFPHLPELSAEEKAKRCRQSKRDRHAPTQKGETPAKPH